MRGFVLKIFSKFLHFPIDEPWRIFLPLRSNETFSPSKHLMEGWFQPFEPEIPNHRVEISLICTNLEMNSWVLPCYLFEVDNGFISWRDIQPNNEFRQTVSDTVFSVGNCANLCCWLWHFHCRQPGLVIISSTKLSRMFYFFKNSNIRRQ